MFHRFLLSVSLLGVLALAGCGADDASRLGAEGESCFDDLDCREPLFCSSAVCTGSSSGTSNGSTSETSNGSTTSTSNGDTNNGFIGCGAICDVLVDCLDGDLDPDECNSGCQVSVSEWTDDEVEDFTECVFESSCPEIIEGQLENCIP